MKSSSKQPRPVDAPDDELAKLLREADDAMEIAEIGALLLEDAKKRANLVRENPPVKKPKKSVANL